MDFLNGGIFTRIQAYTTCVNTGISAKGVDVGSACLTGICPTQARLHPRSSHRSSAGRHRSSCGSYRVSPLLAQFIKATGIKYHSDPSLIFHITFT